MVYQIPSLILTSVIENLFLPLPIPLERIPMYCEIQQQRTSDDWNENHR